MRLQSSGRIAIVGAGAGVVVVVGSSLLGARFEPSFLPFILWGLLPYGLLLLLGLFARRPWLVAGAAATLLAGELGIRAAVFVFPRGSTAALALILSPFVLTAAALPLGAAAGALFGRVWRSGKPGLRVIAATGAVAWLGLLVLALARPELAPWALLRRRAALERIGPPRVVVGDGAFSSVTVSDHFAWFHTADLDPAPGDEIAVLDQRRVRLLDPERFEPLGEVALEAEPGRLINWFSAPARLAGRVVVVQTGGGYSDTEVREVDGRLLWRHRPNPQLPPTSLLPADLDRDGELEFYTAEGDAIARLDAAGRVVWRHAVPYGSGLLLSGPRSPAQPAWVAALSGRTLRVWDERGEPLAERSLGSDAGATALAELGEERVVAFGATTLRAATLVGEPRLELPLGDFSLSQVASVRFSPGAPAELVVAAAAPRDVERWRLLIVSPGGEIRYDEILDHSERPLVARRPDAPDTLLLAGMGLRALRQEGGQVLPFAPPRGAKGKT